METATTFVVLLLVLGIGFTLWKFIKPFLFYDPRNSVEAFEREWSERGHTVVTNKHGNRVYSTVTTRDRRGHEQNIASLEVEANVTKKKVWTIVIVLVLSVLVTIIMRSCGA